MVYCLTNFKICILSCHWPANQNWKYSSQETNLRCLSWVSGRLESQWHKSMWINQAFSDYGAHSIEIFWSLATSTLIRTNFKTTASPRKGIKRFLSTLSFSNRFSRRKKETGTKKTCLPWCKRFQKNPCFAIHVFSPSYPLWRVCLKRSVFSD